MTLTRRILHLLIILAVPLTAALVGKAQAKGHRSEDAPKKAQMVLQCVNDLSADVGASSIAMNQVCTCLADKVPKKNEFKTFMSGAKGRKEFGKCLFLAKDGL